MAQRLKIKATSVTDAVNDIGAAVARKVRLDIADTRPDSPFQARLGQIVRNRQVKVATVMAGYYNGTLKKLGSILNNPPFPRSIEVPQRFNPPITVDVSSGVRGAPAVETLKLESGRDSNTAWKGLGAAYANSVGPRWRNLPVSRTFWRKTGKLAQRYNAWYANNHARLSNPSNYLVGDVQNVKLTRRVKTKPGYVYTVPLSRKSPVSRWTFTVTHPGLDDFLLKWLVQDSYVRGKPREWNLKAARIDRYSYKNKKGRTVFVERAQSYTNKDEAGFMRLAQPEARRPMIARYAAAMGRRELHTLRKVLHKK